MLACGAVWADAIEDMALIEGGAYVAESKNADSKGAESKGANSAKVDSGASADSIDSSAQRDTKSTESKNAASSARAESKSVAKNAESKNADSTQNPSEKSAEKSAIDSAANPSTLLLLTSDERYRIQLKHIIKKIEEFLPASEYSELIAKILLSLAAFMVLWLGRKLITRLVILGINIGFHLTKQEKGAREQIQKDLIKPVSLFLFFVSVDISINILYYPATSPQGLEVWFQVAYVANAAWFIIMALQGYLAAFLSNIAQKNTDHFRKEVINLLLKIIYFIIVIIALLLILKILGFNVSAIIASLGLGGLAVALAVKDMLANFFASVMLLFDNSFSQGERIECGGIDGTVVEMGLRRTTIRTSDNALVLIPNSELANKSITNWSRRKSGRLIKINVGLTYDASRQDIIKCAKAIKAMLLANPNIAKDTDPRNDLDYALSLKRDIISIDDYLGYKSHIYVVLDTLGDSSINILVYCFSKAVGLGEYLQIKEEVTLEILRIIEAQKLTLAFPSQSLYIEKVAGGFGSSASSGGSASGGGGNTGADSRSAGNSGGAGSKADSSRKTTAKPAPSNKNKQK